MTPSRVHPRKRPGPELPRWVMALGIMTAFALAGCGRAAPVEHGGPARPGEEVEIATCEPGKYGGVFVQTDSTEPKTFNPMVPADLSSQEAQTRLFSGLTTTDPFTQEPIPALAKSWVLGEDKKTYTLHLRRGLLWSDGQPFTADDVVFTFDCLFTEDVNPATGKKELRYPSREAEDFTFAGERLRYRKVDDYTVEFYTPQVFSPFMATVGWIMILPKHKLHEAFADGSLLKQWSSQTAIDEPRQIVGLGPYVIERYQPGERIVYRPNLNYWRVDREGKRLPYMDYLIVQFVSGLEAELLLFATGQVDHTAIPATDVPWIIKNEKIYDFTVYKRGVGAGITFFWFNLKPGANKEGKPYLPPHKLAWFSDKRFRQAILYGYDREGLVKGVFFGRAEPTRSVINQGNPKWHNPNVRQYDYDPAKARELLAEAGFRLDNTGRLRDAAGNPVEIELLLFGGSGTVADMATVLKGNLKDLGIELKITFVDFGVVLQRTDATFDYEMAFIGWGSSGGAGDPIGSKALFRSSGAYHVWNAKQTAPATEWEKRVDEIIDAQERTFDQAERVRLFGELQAIFAEELPLLYTVSGYGYQGMKNTWRNLRIPPSGTFLWNIDELWRDPGAQGPPPQTPPAAPVPPPAPAQSSATAQPPA